MPYPTLVALRGPAVMSGEVPRVRGRRSLVALALLVTVCTLSACALFPSSSSQPDPYAAIRSDEPPVPYDVGAKIADIESRMAADNFADSQQLVEILTEILEEWLNAGAAARNWDDSFFITGSSMDFASEKASESDPAFIEGLFVKDWQSTEHASALQFAIDSFVRNHAETIHRNMLTTNDLAAYERFVGAENIVTIDGDVSSVITVAFTFHHTSNSDKNTVEDGLDAREDVVFTFVNVEGTLKISAVGE
jgi:hypothetical protein